MSKKKTQRYESEYQRIKKLSELDLDYLELQKKVKNLVELAGIIAGTEMSVLNLIDNYYQWTVSPSSKEPDQTLREESVCNFTILSKDSLEISRLDLDERFSNNKFAKGEYGLKYYLGIPLTLNSGENIGAMCLADKKERSLTDSTKKALKLIAVEIVEKLEATKKLNETVYALSEAIHMKNQIAHDVRGPIHGITGLAESVESEDISKEEMKEYFQLIKDSGKGILDLTDDILTKIEVVQVIDSNDTNLKQLEEKLYKLYHLPSKSKEIDFNITADTKHEQIFFSKRKLLSIIGNLISNSIKFTPTKGKITVYLEIINSGDGKMMQIKVIDSGKGISETEIEDLYDYKLSSSPGTAGEKGFGLGLKLVSEMVNELDGEMIITSEKNKGTEIELKLPLK